MLNPFIDRKYRVPRVWSNRELARFASIFTGDVVNASAWKDLDKEGKHYRDYFTGAKSYTLTNYKAEARGFQGTAGEIFLDLTGPLPDELKQRFDVVFNHTVLEHIFEVHTAFANLCAMSRDVVILVVPFLQQMHTKYGDFWRFTPLTLDRMFTAQGFEMLYCTFNRNPLASVYLFAIATKHKDRWIGKIPETKSHLDPRPPLDGLEGFVGCHAIPNPLFAFRRFVGSLTRWARPAKQAEE